MPLHNNPDSPPTIEQEIRSRLEDAFTPRHLRVQNDSDRHQGHTGSPGTGESHFTVHIESDTLKNMPRIQAHKAINTCLADLLKGPIHALSIKVIGQSR